MSGWVREHGRGGQGTKVCRRLQCSPRPCTHTLAVMAAMSELSGMRRARPRKELHAAPVSQPRSERHPTVQDPNQTTSCTNAAQLCPLSAPHAFRSVEDSLLCLVLGLAVWVGLVPKAHHHTLGGHADLRLVHPGDVGAEDIATLDMCVGR